MGLSINLLNGALLITVAVFFALMGALFYFAYNKLNAVFDLADSADNLEFVNTARNYVKIAFILAFVGGGLTLLLSILYMGFDTFGISEWFHLVLYLIAFGLLVVSIVYAMLTLYRLYDLGITRRNGADAFIWAGLFMGILGFIGLAVTGAGRIGVNAAKAQVAQGVENIENRIEEYLPDFQKDYAMARDFVKEKLPEVREKLKEGFGSVSNYLEDKLPAIRETVQDVAGNAKKYLEESVPVAKDRLANFVADASAIAGSLRDDLADSTARAATSPRFLPRGARAVIPMVPVEQVRQMARTYVPEGYELVNEVAPDPRLRYVNSYDMDPNLYE